METIARVGWQRQCVRVVEDTGRNPFGSAHRGLSPFLLNIIEIEVQSPHHLVVRTSRCGRDNPGSTPGVDNELDDLATRLCKLQYGVECKFELHLFDKLQIGEFLAPWAAGGRQSRVSVVDCLIAPPLIGGKNNLLYEKCNIRKNIWSSRKKQFIE